MRIQHLVFSVLATALLADAGLDARQTAGSPPAARGVSRPQSAAQASRLADAAKRRDGAAVRALLASGARVNAVDAEGMTALMWSVHHADRDQVTRLLRAGADPKIGNRYGVTPLHEAALQTDLPIVLALLKAGASPAATYGAGETPLMTAARTGNVDTVRALITAGADVNAAERSQGETALMSAVAENHAAAAKVLLEAGARVNARTVNHDFQKVAAKPGNTYMERPFGFLTPLHLAARQGALEAAEVLVGAGADLKAIDAVHGFTPLLTAVINGNYDLAAMLIDNGADVDDGSLYLSVEMRNLDKYTNRPNPPEKDRALTAMDVLTRLLAKGAWVDAPFYYTIPQLQTQGTIRVLDGATPLYRAIKAVDLDAARLLVKHGADASQAANDGSTPLMLLAGAQARRGEEEEVVDAGTRANPLDGIRLLLEAGADVNAVDYAGNTAIHMASARQANAIVELLAARGAKLDVKNLQERTPIDVALGAPLTRAGAGRGGAAGAAAAARTPTPAQQATAALLRRLAESRAN